MILAYQEVKMKSADLIKERRAAGCEPVRQTGGSHQIW